VSVNPDFDLINILGTNQFFIVKYIELSDFSSLISTPLFIQCQLPDCKKQRVDVGHRES